jgi:hypothetical protein
MFVSGVLSSPWLIKAWRWGGGPQTYPLDVFATEGRMVRPNISAEPLSQTLQEQKAI